MNKFSSLTLPGVQDFVLSFFFFIEDKKITTLILVKINKIIENFITLKKNMISSPFFLPVKNDFFKQQFVMKKSVIFEHIQNFMIHLVQFCG